MSEPDSPQTPVGDSPDSQESYMARSMSTTQVTKHRRADRSKKHGKTKPGSRLGKLDESMMKRVHSVSMRQASVKAKLRLGLSCQIIANS